MADSFDVIVIDAGRGGYRAAVLGALCGLRVAVVEESTWGGCCLNRGCVPKKDWYRNARLIEAVGTTDGAWSGELRPDLARALETPARCVQKVRESHLGHMKRLGGRAIAGRACLTARDRVVVEHAGERRELAGAHLILATGAATTRHSPERSRATPSRPAPAPNCAPATPNVRTRSGTVRGLQRH